MSNYTQPTFNAFTLNFPPETTDSPKELGRKTFVDIAHGAAASAITKRTAARRKERRNLRRLQAAVAGGFHLQGRSINRGVTLDSISEGVTRAERRRAQFGRK